MVDEYIRKQDAVDLVNKISNLDLKAKGGICVSLANLQKADVVPVVHAKWEHVKHKSIEHGEVVIDGDTVRCSACRHAKKGWDAGMNFCPECGAKMDGRKED